jgi:hypothetical protein
MRWSPKRPKTAIGFGANTRKAYGQARRGILFFYPGALVIGSVTCYKRRMSYTTLKLPDGIQERVEQIAAALPDEIVTVWGMNLRCYFASMPPTLIPNMFTADEVLGRSATLFVHPADWPHAILTKTDVELTGKSVEFTLHFRNRLGERVRVRNQSLLLKDPDTHKIFFLSRTVPVDRHLSPLPTVP